MEAVRYEPDEDKCGRDCEPDPGLFTPAFSPMVEPQQGNEGKRLIAREHRRSLETPAHHYLRE